MGHGHIGDAVLIALPAEGLVALRRFPEDKIGVRHILPGAAQDAVAVDLPGLSAPRGGTLHLDAVLAAIGELHHDIREAVPAPGIVDLKVQRLRSPDALGHLHHQGLKILPRLAAGDLVRVGPRQFLQAPADLPHDLLKIHPPSSFPAAKRRSLLHFT